MNLTSPTEIKKLFEEFGIAYAKKEFGQNFLVNKGVLKKIVDASSLKKDDVVLEVGPGLGVLTLELAKKVKKVIAVEKDKNMVRVLREVLKRGGIENVEVLNEDILKLDFKKLKLKEYKVVANIPYYLTSALIRKFLEFDNSPVGGKLKKMVLMIQKEVAQRICEKKKMSLLSLSVQFYATPRLLFKVSKGSFFPSPKVDSAVVEIAPKKELSLPKKDIEKFFKLVKAGFSAPRKQLLGNLNKEILLDKEKLKEIFKEMKINEKSRAEDLKEKDWVSLVRKLNSYLS